MRTAWAKLGSGRAPLQASRILLALAVTLVALAAAPRAGAAAEVTDMLGRRVRVLDHPARIVSLAPSITETVFALGEGDRLVGVTDYCDYPPEATRKPRVGGISTPSFEAILALRPDLVLATSESNYADHVQRLVTLGLTVYVIPPGQLKNLRSRYGSAGNKDDRFDAYVLADVVRTDRRRLRIGASVALRSEPVPWAEPVHHRRADRSSSA